MTPKATSERFCNGKQGSPVEHAKTIIGLRFSLIKAYSKIKIKKTYKLKISYFL